MSDIRQARTALVARILEGDGKVSRTQRRAAFDGSEAARAVVVPRSARGLAIARIMRSRFLPGTSPRCGRHRPPGHAARRHQSESLAASRQATASSTSSGATKTAPGIQRGVRRPRRGSRRR